MVSAGWFGPFHLVRALGRGELGEVYFARTPWRTTRCAALKKMRAERSASADFSERFRRSMRVAKAIDHANVVPLFDAGAIEGVLYTCSQLVPGRDVAAIGERLAKRGLGAPAAVGARVLGDLLSALARIETLIEHGALGPRNVIIGWDGGARISDLGLPRDVEVPDLCGLGNVLFRLYTGRSHGELGALRPDLPAWMTELVADLIERPEGSAADHFSVVMRRSIESGLMIPHSAVAQWLGQLFPVERATELGEVAAAIPFVDNDTVLAATLIQRPAPGFMEVARVGFGRPVSATEPEITAWR